MPRFFCRRRERRQLALSHSKTGGMRGFCSGENRITDFLFHRAYHYDANEALIAEMIFSSATCDSYSGGRKVPPM